jgi:hypothetical protein
MPMIAKINYNRDSQVEIIFNEEFFAQPPIIQLDLLQDLIGDLTFAYDTMLTNDVQDFMDFLKELPEDSPHFIDLRKKLK